VDKEIHIFKNLAQNGVRRPEKEEKTMLLEFAYLES